MAKKNAQHSSHVNQMQKSGRPRSHKKTKGNAPSRTSRSGNGKKIR